MCIVCMMTHALGHGQSHSPTTQASAPQNESLLDILVRRYALGEITREQFEEMRRILALSGDSSNLSPLEQRHH